MIAPNMATMLAFIFTDADLSANILKSLLKRNIDNTFNAITVDGDTSTNDMLTFFATGILYFETTSLRSALFRSLALFRCYI